MTRAGVSTVAMAAALISAGALGYAVIWSYGEHERTALLAPLPHEQAPVASVPPPAQETPVAPRSVAEGGPAPVAQPDQQQVRSKSDDTVANAEAAPERLDRVAQAVTAAPEKPAAASAPKDTQSSAAAPLPVERPAARPSAAAPASPLREKVAAAPPMTKLAKPIETPSAAPPPKELSASPPAPAASAKSAAVEPVPAPASRLAVSEAVAPEKPAMLSTPPELATSDVQPQKPDLVPPTRMEMRAAAAIPPPPSLPEKPLTPATAEPSPSSAPINTHVAPPADQRERPDASLPAHKAPDRTAKDHPHMAALPPQTTFDAPALTIIRGNRRSGVARRARTAEKRKLAALPSHAPPARTATDARPIAILRGAPTRRYAFASSAVPPEPLVIIRGARPRPSLLQYYVQPNALILRVPH